MTAALRRRVQIPENRERATVYYPGGWQETRYWRIGDVEKEVLKHAGVTAVIHD